MPDHAWASSWASGSEQPPVERSGFAVPFTLQVELWQLEESSGPPAVTPPPARRRALPQCSACPLWLEGGATRTPLLGLSEGDASRGEPALPGDTLSDPSAVKMRNALEQTFPQAPLRSAQNGILKVALG